MFFVYCILNNLSGKVYIGYTENPLKRWNKHLKIALGKRDKEKFFIHRAISKYGKDNFTFTVFQKFTNEDDCKKAEIYWISHFNSNDCKFGYNLTSGGEGCSKRIVSAETREKIRQKAIDRKHTNETKELLRQINIGKIPVNLEQLKIMNIGKVLSIERRQKISAARTGIIFTEEHRKNISLAHQGTNIGQNNPFYGKTHTEETKNLSRGENNKHARLSAREVIEIREKYNSGRYTHKELSDRYNVARRTITHIINRTTWGHIK